MADIIDIEILEDGTVKVTTDKVSDSNHAAADALLELLEQELGGQRTTTHTKGKDNHHHHHHHHKQKA